MNLLKMTQIMRSTYLAPGFGGPAEAMVVSFAEHRTIEML